jgi:hypothetical protein
LHARSLALVSRRFGLPTLVLLSTAWAWLVFDVVCGAMVPARMMSVTPTPHDGCCHQSAKNEACATPGCGLTCAALLTAAVSETGMELLPAGTSRAWVSEDELAVAVPRCPPVPPPRTLA